MHSLFVWIETSFLSVWARESTSVFAFPAILSVHTVGMGLVAGINAAIDLRILGIAPHVPLTQMKRFAPIMWTGFWLNAASGVVLLIAYPTKALTNPVFFLKLTLIALALVAFRSIRNHVFADLSFDEKPVSSKGRRLAAVSLVCWSGAIITGRFLAYTYVRLSST
jgi:hypothetical protein